MRQLLDILSSFVSGPAHRRGLPALEALEERAVPATVSSIVSNFNGTAIPAGDTVWFSSVFKPSPLGSAPVTVRVTDQTISFSAGGTDYTVPVPDAVVTLSPTVSAASATFDLATKSWNNVLPTKWSGNGFLDGVAFPVTVPLPGGINPVTWRASFSTDTAGVSLNWQWAAAVYKGFSTDNNALGVKPLDANTGTAYANSDHAGTPENFKTLVTGGARGGGGSNYTGSYSATAGVVPAVSVPASISGYVYFDVNQTGVFNPGEPGIVGVTVTLSGTDNQGNTVTETAVTDASGFYQFLGLPPGAYMLTEGPATGYAHGQAAVGTVNGSLDGNVLGTAQLGNILLSASNNGVNYDFGEVVPTAPGS
jgi:hypothetical protein